MATITVTPSQTYGPTDTVTSTNLNLLGGPTAALDAGTIVDADISASANIAGSKLLDSSITKAKIENLANYKVLGNVSGGAAAPSEVTILDEDDMSSDSNTSLVTQQSVKAYVDGGGGFTPSTYAGGESVTLPNGLIMKFGTTTSGIPTFGVAGTISFASSFPTACIYATFITNSYYGGSTANNVIESVSTSQITYKHGMNPAPSVIYWQAIGY
jgi:hypothetical protein